MLDPDRRYRVVREDQLPGQPLLRVEKELAFSIISDSSSSVGEVLNWELLEMYAQLKDYVFEMYKKELKAKDVRIRLDLEYRHRNYGD